MKAVFLYHVVLHRNLGGQFYEKLSKFFISCCAAEGFMGTVSREIKQVFSFMMSCIGIYYGDSFTRYQASFLFYVVLQRDLWGQFHEKLSKFFFLLCCAA